MAFLSFERESSCVAQAIQELGFPDARMTVVPAASSPATVAFLGSGASFHGHWNPNLFLVLALGCCFPFPSDIPGVTLISRQAQ